MDNTFELVSQNAGLSIVKHVLLACSCTEDVAGMREIFVSDLVGELLGPRDGIDEILKPNQKPHVEYITGILASMYDTQEKITSESRHTNEIPDQPHGTYEDDNVEDQFNFESLPNSFLNPDKIPSALGISFQVYAKTKPTLNVCVTWARYVTNEDNNWQRHPKWLPLEITEVGEQHKYFDATGLECEKSNGEILIVSRINPLTDGKFFISIFAVNVIPITDKTSAQNQFIYQPQIRVVCTQGTELTPMNNATDADPEEEFIFRNKKFFARGHMTSAVWWDIDPENLPPSIGKEFDATRETLPFKWLDGQIVPEDLAEMFSKPTVRTEYIPMYSIPSPEIELEDSEIKQILKADEFTKMWDPKKLRHALHPLQKQYADWIENLDKEKDGIHDKVVDSIKNKCKTILARINSGIETLVADEYARLAFCFANKAVDMQSQWSRNEGMTYRPFQLAFILTCLESVVNPNSKFRETCDLLWVPTAAGKTEAYLVLVAISMAYRRLKELESSKSGAGVDVISRYTLRLLTIQQFRRSLSLFAAAEKLRVYNLPSQKSIGWRPQGFDDCRDFLWGSTPFSVGLWVGSGVTPNKLEDSDFKTPEGKYENRPGALTLIKKPSENEAEPAQILECPACKNILAIPEMGLMPGSDPHEINWVVETDMTTQDLKKLKLNELRIFNIIELRLHSFNNNYKILTIEFTNTDVAKTTEIDYLWSQLSERMCESGKRIKLECAAPFRPGYFYKCRINSKNELKEYDFQVFCPKKECPLEYDWVGGAPYGGINHSVPDPNLITNCSDNLNLDDGNNLIEIKPCFRKSKSTYVSTRIPINGFTVDEQIYRSAPTMVISTVDKFARLPFEPQTGILFGNIDYCHMIYGYYRYDDKHLQPEGRTSKFWRKINPAERLPVPSLIIQDELHLLEGPLGSMTGLYESCIDFLSTRGGRKIKYIASTATIKHGEQQVRSLFTRDLSMFPPPGIEVDNRFFIREKKEHPLQDFSGGRLYVGIMAPGKGLHTLVIRAWSRLAQTGFDNQGEQEIDRFWTITGYFNAIRELAGARALYRQDIPERIKDLSPNPRNLYDDKVQELSGRTHSSDLPSILNLLETKYPKAADGLFTTSMFGTGVDISRIGLMVVVGQPKTTSAYIQSTGRVGRLKGGLVPVLFRASRPRDLSHYEYFMRNHIQLHRTVEPPTVSPFASNAVERSLGPVIVAMLRNMRNTNTPWCERESAMRIKDAVNNPEIPKIRDFLEQRAQSQPDKRKPEQNSIHNKIGSCIDKWLDVANNVDYLKYVEYDRADTSVVLGDARHGISKSVETVFPNTPGSLRDIEEETGFQT